MIWLGGGIIVIALSSVVVQTLSLKTHRHSRQYDWFMTYCRASYSHTHIRTLIFGYTILKIGVSLYFRYRYIYSIQKHIRYFGFPNSDFHQIETVSKKVEGDRYQIASWCSNMPTRKCPHVHSHQCSRLTVAAGLRSRSPQCYISPLTYFTTTK